MKFLYNLLRAYRIATQELPYNEVYDLEGSWTEEEQRIAAAFFNSPTGRLLKQRLLNMVIRAQASACESPDNAQFKVGIARGAALTVNALQEHFLIRAPSA